MLTQLLYCSERDPAIALDLSNLLTGAIRHNRREGVTGLLWHDGRVFVQLLEGSRKAVSDLYARISRDPRHRSVELLMAQEMTERSFSSWAMGLVDEAGHERNRETILKFSSGPTFDPFVARPETVRTMMLALRDCVPA